MWFIISLRKYNGAGTVGLNWPKTPNVNSAFGIGIPDERSRIYALLRQRKAHQ